MTTLHPDTTTQGRLFWTVDEIAKQRWNCHTLTVYHLIKDRKLRAHRIGRLIRISKEELERFEAAAADERPEANNQ